MKKIEKSPLESKKFIAVMIWSLCWLALTAYGIRTSLNADVLLAMIYINGMVQGMFLGGQSFVDGIVRKAMAMNGSAAESSPIKVELK